MENEVKRVDETARTAKEHVEGLNERIREADALGRQFSTTLTSAFTSIAFRGKGVSDTLRSVAMRLSEITLKAALKPLEQGLGNMFSGMFQAALPFAKGGVVNSKMVVPFAKGGVVQSPITFPLSGGQIGLAGERGAEAIMPLARGPDGRLGVQSQAGRNAINVTFNVSTPDADSFQRSETQVAAMLARAVSRGQRNL